MTEQEWLDGTDTGEMFRFLEARGLTDRRWWLIFFNHDLLDLTFAPSDIPEDERDAADLIRAKCAAGFRFADGEVAVEDVLRARFPHKKLGKYRQLDPALEHVRRELDVRPETWAPGGAPAMCGMVRDIAGNPFRPLPAVRAFGGLMKVGWLNPEVLALAAAAYDEHAADGTLDRHRLSILADALLDAGVEPMLESPGPPAVWRCNPLLEHLRSPGPHYRGCHAVDHILGKE